MKSITAQLSVSDTTAKKLLGALNCKKPPTNGRKKKSKKKGKSKKARVLSDASKLKGNFTWAEYKAAGGGWTPGKRGRPPVNAKAVTRAYNARTKSRSAAAKARKRGEKGRFVK